MVKAIISILRTGLPVIWATSVAAQPSSFQLQPERLQQLPFGTVSPAGWIRHQMQGDLRGFVGHLDRIVPDLIGDSIYQNRLHAHSRARDLGNLKQGDIGGDDQYKWWNSETQSNWRDGFIRHVLLLQDTSFFPSLDQYLSGILQHQDQDGYLGIYGTDLRYRFTSENGELWAKATLLRGLLAAYEATGDTTLLRAVKSAVGDVMQHYPVYRSNPFFAGREFSGGVAHGLMFTDVCETLFRITGWPEYRRYGLFLYENFSSNFSFEKDIQLPSILNPDYRLSGHGVHSYEHLRALTLAAFSSKDTVYRAALQVYLKRIATLLTPSGGPIGDEWIGGRTADATQTGYEYCSIQELMDSYGLLMQKTGDARYGDLIERIFYNAAQGARHPDRPAIAYLKTDNSYAMTGTRNGGSEKNQTRYKYSPAHQDAAVCCVPNAGRLSPYFVQYMWMRQGPDTLVAALLGPSVLKSRVGDKTLQIRVQTRYPYENRLHFTVTVRRPVTATLKIRKPNWVRAIQCSMPCQELDGFVYIRGDFVDSTGIDLVFETEVQEHSTQNGDIYFSYGALVYTHPLESIETAGRSYAPGFTDYFYQEKGHSRYCYQADNDARYQEGSILLRLINKATGQPEPLKLVPIGQTILRQTSFPDAP
ncbi:beta-L-arabinofuranosidase domain-containing protein [Niabella terrae]